MKIIYTSQHMKAMVDDEDFKYISRYRWYRVVPTKSKTLNYAGAKGYPDGNRKTVLMHRLIMQAPKGVSIDHIDGNGLNNQKSNLRFCTKAENVCNSKLQSTNTSGFRGVSIHKPTGKYRAYVFRGNKQIHIGLYNTKNEAALARDKKAKELYGEFAVLNIV